MDSDALESYTELHATIWSFTNKELGKQGANDSWWWESLKSELSNMSLESSGDYQEQ